MKKKLYISILIFVLIIIDQVIKFIIESNNCMLPIDIINEILTITYCQNGGVAFGFGADNMIFFIICNIVILSILVFLLYSKKNELNIIMKIWLGIIIAGGTSNLIDRILKGYVIDYIDITNLFDFPIFNIADILICVGTICIGILYVKENMNHK